MLLVNIDLFWENHDLVAGDALKFAEVQAILNGMKCMKLQCSMILFMVQKSCTIKHVCRISSINSITPRPVVIDRNLQGKDRFENHAFSGMTSLLIFRALAIKS